MLLGLNDYNNIKPTNDEVISLQKEIDNCNNENIINKDSKVIKIYQIFYQIFKSMKQNDLRYTEYGKKITFIINNLKNQNETITLKKIRENIVNYILKK